MDTMPDDSCGVAAGLRFAYVLTHPHTPCRSWADVQRWQPPDGPLWIHLERGDPTSHAWVRSNSGLDPVMAEALLAEESRPRVESVGDGLLIVLRGISRVLEGRESELGGDTDLVPVHIWIDGHRVISLRDQDHFLGALRDIRADSILGKGPTRTGELLALIAYTVTRDIEPVLDAMDDEMDMLEDLVLENAELPFDHAPHNAIRYQINGLRRRATHLRRYLAPQREALSRLQREECSWLSTRDRIIIREDGDRVLRFIESLDALRDRATIAYEDLSSQASEQIARISVQMARNSNRLTALAAMLLPPSVIAGLFGMNVGGIPWGQDSNGFIIAVVGAVASSVGILFVLRVLKWL